MAAGMFAAAAGGIGIGLLLPTGGGGRVADEAPKARAPADTAAPRDDSASVVHEDVSEIAEDIPRPAIIQDATRAQVEELQPRYPGMKGWRMHWDMQARARPPATPATPATPTHPTHPA
mgnify:CR=1 FL=1